MAAPNLQFLVNGVDLTKYVVQDAWNVSMDFKNGTSSASLVALPSVATAHARPPKRPIWQFAPGPPDATAFLPVAL